MAVFFNNLFRSSKKETKKEKVKPATIDSKGRKHITREVIKPTKERNAFKVIDGIMSELGKVVKSNCENPSVKNVEKIEALQYKLHNWLSSEGLMNNQSIKDFISEYSRHHAQQFGIDTNAMANEFNALWYKIDGLKEPAGFDATLTAASEKLPELRSVIAKGDIGTEDITQYTNEILQKATKLQSTFSKKEILNEIERCLVKKYNEKNLDENVPMVNAFQDIAQITAEVGIQLSDVDLTIDSKKLAEQDRASIKLASLSKNAKPASKESAREALPDSLKNKKSYKQIDKIGKKLYDSYKDLRNGNVQKYTKKQAEVSTIITEMASNAGQDLDGGDVVDKILTCVDVVFEEKSGSKWSADKTELENIHSVSRALIIEKFQEKGLDSIPKATNKELSSLTMSVPELQQVHNGRAIKDEQGNLPKGKLTGVQHEAVDRGANTERSMR